MCLRELFFPLGRVCHIYSVHLETLGWYFARREESEPIKSRQLLLPMVEKKYASFKCKEAFKGENLQNKPISSEKFKYSKEPYLI